MILGFLNIRNEGANSSIHLLGGEDLQKLEEESMIKKKRKSKLVIVE